MYADRITDSMRRAIDETERRRAKQEKYNREHGIVPVSIMKAVRDLTDEISVQSVAEPKGEYRVKGPGGMPKGELQRLIAELEKQMKEAAKDLQFEKAAVLRDQVFELRGILAEESNLKPWERVRLMAGEEGVSSNPKRTRVPRRRIKSIDSVSRFLIGFTDTLRADVRFSR